MAILCLGCDKAAHGLPLGQINTPAEPLDMEISRAGGKPLAEVTGRMHEPRVDHERLSWPMKRRDTSNRCMMIGACSTVEVDLKM